MQVGGIYGMLENDLRRYGVRERRGGNRPSRVRLTPLQRGSDPADCFLWICISSECAGEGDGWDPSALLLLLKGHRGSR